MAEFAPAYAKLRRFEGGYANEPEDRGGETWRGISRVYWPYWVGWRIIDSLRSATDFPANLGRSQQLEDAVQEHYRREYWDRILGDRLTSQSVAEELFEQAVHLGVHRAVVFLQRGLNVLNKGGTLWPDLILDGHLGHRTYTALNRALVHHPEQRVLMLLRVQQGAWYISLMERDASQEKFVGWFDRV